LTTTETRFAKIIDRRSHYRRKHPRAAVTWPVTVISKNKTLQGRVENISRGGALLYLTEQLEIQDPLRVAIEIPDCSDVITAEGTVVRTFTLKRGDEQQFTTAVAIEFTEISEKDLRYFSGNLAPEWKEDYVETKETEESPRSKKDLRKYALSGIFIISLLSLMYFIPRTDKQDKIDPHQIEQIDERLKILQSQLESFQSAIVSIKNIQENIDTIKAELSNVEKKLPAMETVEKMRHQLESNEQKTYALSKAIDDYSKSLISLPPEKNTEPSQNAYHVVKKGEGLYRISLNYNLTIDEIRRLNNLKVSSQIFPGQKLLVR
jgi:LysM repeat protein